MKIELKNTDFKELYEFICETIKKHPSTLQCWLFDGANIIRILEQGLKPQYQKAFLKYQNEIQEFKPRQKVKFRFNSKSEWLDGFIHKVGRLANGQYRYTIGYKDTAEDYHYDNGDKVINGMIINYTNPMTKKNIKKI